MACFAEAEPASGISIAFRPRGVFSAGRQAFSVKYG
jgi:hypothetical protein